MNDIHETDYEKIYHRAIEAYGEDMQVNIAIEEMAELIKAIIKYKRYVAGRCSVQQQEYIQFTKDAGIAEEIADVRIMLDQLELIFCVKNEVDEIIHQKMDRLEKRLESGI